jgi:hypothetical protein
MKGPFKAGFTVLTDQRFTYNITVLHLWPHVSGLAPFVEEVGMLASHLAIMGGGVMPDTTSRK